jgi:dihydroxyacid dehydratase/phosphogluconate dehydratase
MDKFGLNTQTGPMSALPAVATVEPRRRKHAGRRFAVLGLMAFVLLALQARTLFHGEQHKVVHLPMHAQETLNKCKNLHTLPG